MAKSKKKKDWRSRPRKPAAMKRSCAYGLRLTPGELDALRANSAAAGSTVNGFIVDRCCRPPR